MTREEAIAQLKMDRDLCNFNPMTGEEEPMSEDCRKSAEALDMAIKALEQEPILDKIRAEIKALNPEPTAYDVVDGNPIKDAVWETLADVLKIIDKYKAESEDKE
jgi:hypothetical protein